MSTELKDSNNTFGPGPQKSVTWHLEGQQKGGVVSWLKDPLKAGMSTLHTLGADNWGRTRFSCVWRVCDLDLSGKHPIGHLYIQDPPPTVCPYTLITHVHPSPCILGVVTIFLEGFLLPSSWIPALFSFCWTPFSRLWKPTWLSQASADYYLLEATLSSIVIKVILQS
jgi:hypothetical protein